MAKKSALNFIDLSRRFIQSIATKQKYRVSEKDFTRSRKLTFATMALCMIKLLKQNLQVELTSYFSDINRHKVNEQMSVTSSAFVQSRKKIKPDMFYDLSKIVSDDFYQDNDENVKLYKGHRLLSVDGSAINLPVNKATKEAYGTYNNQNITNDVVLGRVSIMYDLLNEIVLDGILCNHSIGEVPLSREHIKNAKESDIIIMDRAYPSFESIYEMQKRNIQFIYRCRSNFSNQANKFYESKQKEAVIEITPAQTGPFKDLPYTKDATILVRMLRIKLSSGEIEILMTSLLDNKTYPYTDFKELYFKRWGIETYYNRFKNIIGVENFSGTSDQFIQQEFNCALYMSNMQSILTKDAQEEADEKYLNRKYEYKINTSLSLCFIRNKLVKLFTSQKENEELMQELKTLFVVNVVPIRPNRTFIRDHDKYRTRTKPKQFNNRRYVL
mgnify:CR=1 FL=1|jgi:hypothetical protein